MKTVASRVLKRYAQNMSNEPTPAIGMELLKRFYVNVYYTPNELHSIVRRPHQVPLATMKDLNLLAIDRAVKAYGGKLGGTFGNKKPMVQAYFQSLESAKKFIYDVKAIKYPQITSVGEVFS